MEIRELNLIGFGKFNNETINLKNGINIIYGENEAGKTTIHNFIDGMFYGFLKHGARRTLYVDEHDRYIPWSGTKYSGIIKFKQNGEKYTIEREFTKSKEKTTVLIYNTGEDITKEIETGNAGRVLQPGYHFFGFNDAVYSNTVSIKQLASKTEDSLANEIRDKLINISTTADDSLSIENAVEELEQSIKDIGSNRAPTSDYGRSIKALDHLKEEKEKTLEFKGKYDEALELSTQLREQLNNKNREMEELGERLANAKLLEKINIYNKAREIKEKISQLQLSREEYKQYKDLS